jgi:hypothetical protein
MKADGRASHGRPQLGHAEWTLGGLMVAAMVHWLMALQVTYLNDVVMPDSAASSSESDSESGGSEAEEAA